MGSAFARAEDLSGRLAYSTIMEVAGPVGVWASEHQLARQGLDQAANSSDPVGIVGSSTDRHVVDARSALESTLRSPPTIDHEQGSVEAMLEGKLVDRGVRVR